MTGERESLLREARQGRLDTAAALRLFDSLPAVAVADMTVIWRGEGLHSGHPLDGVLERFNWFGKEFRSPEEAFPLLFPNGAGRPVAVDPRFLPFDLALRLGLARSDLAARAFPVLRWLARTRRPSARLRMMEERGVVTATMIYDHLPICDLFRRLDADSVMGLMDYRGFDRPFFFALRRHTPRALGGKAG
ncbi:DUF4334 domain-containing protein [Cereibacter sphaeroides]|uniref:DUF4334 domain-containing protein n=1 Tax=Cereibacter sphaeroides TaxID=1063 RepID=UPI001F22FC63|nr:DUF4334 domain-containing protein [Cereibacter sphaeroides]MCE6960814.1 DUF4334 domain-containing protein [Cereibacter sphaeroides]MCE6974308.1 DUF4334 domain-containing protein [Cereibacter sphaeroides]